MITRLSTDTCSVRHTQFGLRRPTRRRRCHPNCGGSIGMRLAQWTTGILDSLSLRLHSAVRLRAIARSETTRSQWLARRILDLQLLLLKTGHGPLASATSRHGTKRNGTSWMACAASTRVCESALLDRRRGTGPLE